MPRHFKYYGISHGLPTWRWFLALWRKIQCPRGKHLLDEVWGMRSWFLSCDACHLEAYIMTVDDKYVRKAKDA